jgi:hypothetical protein
MAKIQRTDNTEDVLNDFFNRMDLIQTNIKGFEGKPEVFMAYSLQVQIESEKMHLSSELSKIKILESIRESIDALAGDINDIYRLLHLGGGFKVKQVEKGGK